MRILKHTPGIVSTIETIGRMKSDHMVDALLQFLTSNSIDERETAFEFLMEISVAKSSLKGTPLPECKL